MKKLIINGHARHGKDYLAAAVSEELGLVHLNASMYFAEKYVEPAFNYGCVELAYKDRVNKRALWYEMMRMHDWQQNFMQLSDVFTGHRNIEEHQEMHKTLDCLAVFVVWSEKPWEDPSSCQWQDWKDIYANHDLVLTHSGYGTAKMVNRIKSKLHLPTKVIEQ